MVLHVGRSCASGLPQIQLGSAALQRWILPGGMPRRLSIRGGQDVDGGQGGEAVVMAHDGAGRASVGGSLTPGLTPGPGVADGEEIDDFLETEMEDLERELEEAQDARAVAELV